jgi:hypothetical protein
MSKKDKKAMALTAAMTGAAMALPGMAGEPPVVEPVAEETEEFGEKAEKDEDKAKKNKKVKRQKKAKKKARDFEPDFSMPAGTAYDVISRSDIG